MDDSSPQGTRSVSLLARFDDYDEVQNWAILLLYIQAGCAMIGSLGYEYSAIQSTNLVLALFALVAIESGSQRLGRSYAGFLGLMLVLDAVWLVLFGPELWNVDLQQLGWRKGWSIRVSLAMEGLGFLIRLGSAVLWVKMYRLGVAEVDSGYQPVDFDGRIGALALGDGSLPFQGGGSDSVGGPVYNPSTYSALNQSPYQNSFVTPEKHTRSPPEEDPV